MILSEKLKNKITWDNIFKFKIFLLHNLFHISNLKKNVYDKLQMCNEKKNRYSRMMDPPILE